MTERDRRDEENITETRGTPFIFCMNKVSWQPLRSEAEESWSHFFPKDYLVVLLRFCSATLGRKAEAVDPVRRLSHNSGERDMRSLDQSGNKKGSRK